MTQIDAQGAPEVKVFPLVEKEYSLDPCGVKELASTDVYHSDVPEGTELKLTQFFYIYQLNCQIDAEAQAVFLFQIAPFDPSKEAAPELFLIGESQKEAA